MIRSLLYFLIFCLTSLSATLLKAQQQEIIFEHLSVQDGLSNNVMYCMLQDREGFMWFGTRDGLNKYDGYTFTVYQPDPADPTHNLRHNWIRDLHEDRTGVLWVVTGEGLHKVDKLSGRFTYYPVDSFPKSIRNIGYAICEDSQGKLLITSEGGINEFDPTTEKYTLYPAPNEDKHLNTIAVDKLGLVWIGTSTGLYQLNRSAKRYTRFPLDADHPEALHKISAIYRDSSENLWVASYGAGLYLLQPDSKTATLYQSQKKILDNCFIFSNGIWESSPGVLWLGTNDGLKQLHTDTGELKQYRANHMYPGSLSNNEVRVVYEDPHHKLWAGSVNGIDKLTGLNKKFHTYQITPDATLSQLPENNIDAICEDHQGFIWVGTYFNGLYRYNRENGAYANFRFSDNNPNSLLSSPIYAIYEDQNNELWVGTSKGLHKFDRKADRFIRYPSEIFIQSICEDKYGKLWAGGNGLASLNQESGEFTYYENFDDEPEAEKIKRITKMISSRSGELWLATSSQFIRKFDPVNGNFIPYRHNLNDSSRLEDNDIRSLYEDQEGILWIGTNQSGLNRFDPKTETFTAFTKHDGLPSNYIAAILSDQYHNLWISTHQGISKFNPKTGVFLNYDQNFGILDNNFTDAHAVGKNGQLLFGGKNGFTIFHPDSIRDNLQIPPIYITGFKVLEKSRPLPTDQVTLPYDQNFLSFDFVALNYEAPEKNKYAYMLAGVDKDWIYSGSRRYASYTDLPSGSYTFKVKGSNNDGVWNEEGSSIQIKILPPWWRSWWAYSLYACFAIGFLLSARHLTLRRERLKHALKLQTMEAEKMHEVDHMKSRFFANISHEFRTPLTLISSIAERLQDEDQDKPWRKKEYNLLHRYTARLLSLINQLLDLSRLENDNLRVQAQPVRILQFLQILAASYTSLAESKGIRYHYFLPEEEKWLLLDEDKMEKVIVNLLGNAFKFTSAGGIVCFSVELYPARLTPSGLGPEELQEAQQEYELLIRVEDSGIGISQEHLNHIFERFYQADDTSSRGYEGAGIGLALTREMLHLMQGTIEVKSAQGKGSTFTVKLPLKTTSPSEQSMLSKKAMQISNDLRYQPETLFTERETESGKEKEKYRILLAEDNEDLRTFIAHSFGNDYQILQAANGQEALEMAFSQHPDLLISDVMMPLMDGFELCDKLKLDERTSHLPIILLTARAGDENRMQGLQTGADAYLTKPFRFDELRLRVSKLLEQRQKLRMRYIQQISLLPKDIEVSSADATFINRLCKLMERHISDTEFDVETLSHELGVSRVHLHRKLKSLSGQAPSDFIRNFRLERAALLLEKESGNISEVAYTVGFSSLTHFSKCFRKKYDMSPSEYQQKKTENQTQN